MRPVLECSHIADAISLVVVLVGLFGGEREATPGRLEGGSWFKHGESQARVASGIASRSKR